MATKRAASKKSGKKSAGTRGGSKKGGARKGGAKKGAAGKRGAGGQLSAGKARGLGQIVNIDRISASVGDAVRRALATQDTGFLRGKLIAGIIYDLQTKTFKPYFQPQLGRGK